MILSILATVAVLAAIAVIAAALVLAETVLVYVALGLAGLSVLLLLGALVQGRFGGTGPDRTGTDGLGKSSVRATTAPAAAATPGAHVEPEHSGRVPAPASGPVRRVPAPEHPPWPAPAADDSGPGEPEYEVPRWETPTADEWPEADTAVPAPSPPREESRWETPAEGGWPVPAQASGEGDAAEDAGERPEAADSEAWSGTASGEGPGNGGWDEDLRDPSLGSVDHPEGYRSEEYGREPADTPPEPDARADAEPPFAYSIPGRSDPSGDEAFDSAGEDAADRSEDPGPGDDAHSAQEEPPTDWSEPFSHGVPGRSTVWEERPVEEDVASEDLTAEAAEEPEPGRVEAAGHADEPAGETNPCATWDDAEDAVPEDTASGSAFSADASSEGTSPADEEYGGAEREDAETTGAFAYRVPGRREVPAEDDDEGDPEETATLTRRRSWGPGADHGPEGEADEEADPEDTAVIVRREREVPETPDDAVGEGRDPAADGRDEAAQR
ncbi:hypothetical protein [Nocardiopsis sp. FR6]|uniref:hypothetical protein n=1 Tax=Nocardiopsis sp. FR6 TaxID=2605986 RepID=UPI001359C894|nr:hypothetical protein [Nocardiopsis sp. FR6]